MPLLPARDKGRPLTSLRQGTRQGGLPSFPQLQRVVVLPMSEHIASLKSECLQHVIRAWTGPQTADKEQWRQWTPGIRGSQMQSPCQPLARPLTMTTRLPFVRCAVKSSCPPWLHQLWQARKWLAKWPQQPDLDIRFPSIDGRSVREWLLCQGCISPLDVRSAVSRWSGLIRLGRRLISHNQQATLANLRVFDSIHQLRWKCARRAEEGHLTLKTAWMHRKCSSNHEWDCEAAASLLTSQLTDALCIHATLRTLLRSC